MNWIDKKYINLISGELRNFRWKTDTTASCSCPICGDSKKNKFKARFYFIQETSYFKTYCHNCHYGAAFGAFLKYFNEALYVEYRKETFKEKQLNQREVIQEPVFTTPTPIFTDETNPLYKLKRVNLLKSDHPAKVYCLERKIPTDKFDRIWYSDNYKAWVNTFIPDKFKHTDEPDERIVLPYISEDGNFFGATGRTVSNSELRYIAVSVDHEKKYPHLFGLDKLNKDELFFIVEGPIDSLFLSNSLAMGTTNINFDKFNFENGIFVLDNEPRNAEIISAMEKVIDKGLRICIWPEGIQYKDINEMVLNGIEPESIIRENHFRDLEARLKLSYWRKA